MIEQVLCGGPCHDAVVVVHSILLHNQYQMIANSLHNSSHHTMEQLLSEHLEGHGGHCSTDLLWAVAGFDDGLHLLEETVGATLQGVRPEADQQGLRQFHI